MQWLIAVADQAAVRIQAAVRRWQVLNATACFREVTLSVVDDVIGQIVQALRTCRLRPAQSQRLRGMLVRLRDLRAEVPAGNVSCGQFRVLSQRVRLICAG